MLLDRLRDQDNVRRRFIQSREPPYDLFEVTEDYINSRSVPVVGDRHYDGLQATDGTDISTRSKHREYMKKNGLTTADDFTESWSKAAQQRAEYFQGKSGAISREDVARAISQLENKK